MRHSKLTYAAQRRYSPTLGGFVTKPHSTPCNLYRRDHELEGSLARKNTALEGSASVRPGTRTNFGRIQGWPCRIPGFVCAGHSCAFTPGRFYFERVGPISGDKPEAEVVGRATPLENSGGHLVLEVARHQGNWHEIIRGTAEQIIDCIASDTKGIFHGLGALDKSLREMGGRLKRVEVKMLTGLRFVYASTGADCPFHEALFHFFGMPIDIIAEPRQWYAYHRRPHILEVSHDCAQVLAAFTADGLYGSFSGVCLYALVNNRWQLFTIKPNQAGDIATARAWLEKRGWQAW